MCYIGCMEDLRSADDAAAEIGIHPSRVRKMAAQYSIGRRIGGTWVFGPDDIAALRAHSTGKAGRPPNKKEAGVEQTPDAG